MTSEAAPNGAAKYDFDFSWESTYGHAVKMLDAACGPGIVVDLGCGEGTFAAGLARVGRDSVVFDRDPASIERCRQAGLDAAVLDLADLGTDAGRDRVYDRIAERVAGRPVAAVSLLDVVEHLIDPALVFEALAGLLDRFGAARSDGVDPLLVLSIPNVAHTDLGAKLLLGRWDVTDTGLLDETHVTLFTNDRLEACTAAAGFVETARADKAMIVTEQNFPTDDPAVSRLTNLRQFLERTRDLADAHGPTYQFVRAYRHDPEASVEVRPALPGDEADSARPFCSVVMRTQGRLSIDDALTCLAAQTDSDLEVVIVVHDGDDETIEGVISRVEMYSNCFASRVRVLPVHGGGRAAPLNAGMAAARGRYVAFLDDDDVVTADWVEQFRLAAEAFPGRVLRALTAVQDHEQTGLDLIPYAPVGGLTMPYRRQFDFVWQRMYNHTPICSWAIPLGAVRALRLEFDDSLPVCEDWDLLMRSAALLEVSNREQFTSVYRRFGDGWGSAVTVEEQVWAETVVEIKRRLDAFPTLMPPGSFTTIEQIYDEYIAMAAQFESAVRAHSDLAIARDRIDALERSRFWRATGPLRWLLARRGAAVGSIRRIVRRPR